MAAKTLAMALAVAAAIVFVTFGLMALDARMSSPGFRCTEDAVCWNALIDGNHRGHVDPFQVSR